MCDNGSFSSGDPEHLTTSVGPASALPNGTLFVFRGSCVSFNCSASSGSPRRLSWAFRGASGDNGSLVSAAGPHLNFRIAAVEPRHQGIYVCRAPEDGGQPEVTAITQLLVYCE